jgi:hypothetical protein
MYETKTNRLVLAESIDSESFQLSLRRQGGKHKKWRNFRKH